MRPGGAPPVRGVRRADRGDPLSDLIVQLEDIVERAIVSLAPDVMTVGAVYEL